MEQRLCPYIRRICQAMEANPERCVDRLAGEGSNLRQQPAKDPIIPPTNAHFPGKSSALSKRGKSKAPEIQGL